MSETVLTSLLSIAAALLGSTVGAFAVFRADDRRFRREGQALTRAVLTDLLAWSEACRYAAEDGRRVLHKVDLVQWREVAPTLTLYLPRGLWMLMFGLFQERAQTEYGYEVMSSDAGPTSRREYDTLRFNFRRWIILSEEVQREFNSYYGRSWFRKHIPILNQHPARSGEVNYVVDVMETRTAQRLAAEFEYEVTPDGSLSSEVARQNKNNAEREAWLAEQDEGPKTPMPTGDPGGGNDR